MAEGSGWLDEPCIAMLWGSRGWQNLYKVGEYSPGTMGDVDE